MANNTLLEADNFVSGSLAAGWATWPTLGGKSQVVAGSPNAAEPVTLGTEVGQIWTGITWPTDQISEVTIGNLTAATTETATLGLGVRILAGQYTGYVANLSITVGGGAQAFLYRADNDSFTQLANVTGLTFSVGDVFALEAAGSLITLYQNGAVVFQVADPTYSSGYPGFNQVIASAGLVATNQVYSWRGYNLVQQDGIWTKQGITLAAIASDLSSSGYGVYQFSQILHEGNAQILSGTVYKVWFSGGGATTGNIYYAESLDGISWSRKATAVISAFVNCSIFKNGSTYYLYAQPQAGGDVAVYTSSDGIIWNQQSSTALAPGGGGSWDESNLFLLKVVGIISGTWYGLYSATDSSGVDIFKIGLATSPDGITWTKYGSNPVLSNAATSGAVVNIGGTYYAWFPTGPTGAQFGGGGQGYNPAETIRYQSMDLIHWTNAAMSLHHSQMYEGLNFIHGSAPATAIIDIGGKAYLYTIAAPSDQLAPQNYQIGLQIGPAAIANIVQFNEDAVSQIAADSFTSGIGDLDANWITPTGGTKLKIVSGDFVEATALSTVCAMLFTGSSFTNNQYSEVTIATLATENYAQPSVRGQSGSLSGYDVTIQGAIGSLVAGLQINKRVSGTATGMGPSYSTTLTAGDVIRLAVITGSDGFPVLSVYQNGRLLLQVQDYGNTFTSGSPGMMAYATTSLGNSQISSWAGGNANVIPTYQPTLPPPSFNPIAGSYHGNLGVQLSASQGATVYYTTDGTTPTSSSPSVPAGNKITLTSSCTVQAYASQAGFNDSAIASAAYTILPALPSHGGGGEAGMFFPFG